jgi:hypothetical protein
MINILIIQLSSLLGIPNSYTYLFDNLLFDVIE